MNCAVVVVDREAISGPAPNGGGLDRIKQKVFFLRPAGLSTEVGPIRGAGAAQRIVGGLNSHGISYWLTNSAAKLRHCTYSNAWTMLVDRLQQFGPARARRVVRFMAYYFQPVFGGGNNRP